MNQKLFERLRYDMKNQCASRPFVTVSFAQSLDGCLAPNSGCQTILSGPDSLTMTHKLRREHESILVGIDTVISDDPRLTVRLVDGYDPMPIVLDSQLRIPCRSRLIQNSADRLTIFTSSSSDLKKRTELEGLGVRILNAPLSQHGLDLSFILSCLKRDGINSIMIEGGGRIISSFLSKQMVDFLVITTAPMLLGSRSAIRYQASSLGTNVLVPEMMQLGRDLITWGQPSWPSWEHSYESVAELKGWKT